MGCEPVIPAIVRPDTLALDRSATELYLSRLSHMALEVGGLLSELFQC